MSSIRRSAALLACALALALAAACSPTTNDTRAATAGMPDLLQQLTAHFWVLDPAASSPPQPFGADHQPVFLSFGDNHAVTGVGPCYPYVGVALIDDFSLRIENLRADVGPPGGERTCTPEGLARDKFYLQALAQVRHVDATDRKKLVLSGPNDVKLSYNADTDRFLT